MQIQSEVSRYVSSMSLNLSSDNVKTGVPLHSVGEFDMGKPRQVRKKKKAK